MYIYKRERGDVSSVAKSEGYWWTVSITVVDQVTLMASVEGSITSLAYDYLNYWLYAADNYYGRIYAVRTIANEDGTYDLLPLLVAPGVDKLAIHPYKG